MVSCSKYLSSKVLYNLETQWFVGMYQALG